MIILSWLIMQSIIVHAAINSILDHELQLLQMLSIGILLIYRQHLYNSFIHSEQHSSIYSCMLCYTRNTKYNFHNCSSDYAWSCRSSLCIIQWHRTTKAMFYSSQIYRCIYYYGTQGLSCDHIMVNK